MRGRVALVPTMGCLHEGHLSLIRAARKQADHVMVSIYVNPLQFGPDEDFAAYPRDFGRDARLCEQAGTDTLFHPDNLYPDGPPRVSLTVDASLAGCLCGKTRPGHFDGVATVVAKLLNLARPDIAVFGEKDWQQLVIIRRMTRDLNLPVNIVSHPTVREADGLAMSSRNRYLAPDERRRAAALFAALSRMREAVADGEAECPALIRIGRETLADAAIEPEYLEIRDECTLQPLAHVRNGKARAFAVARIGRARLIDNIALPPAPTETP